MESIPSNENNALKKRLAELAKRYKEVEDEDTTPPRNAGDLTNSSLNNSSTVTPKPKSPLKPVSSQPSVKVSPHKHISLKPSPSPTSRNYVTSTSKTPTNTPITPSANSQPLPDDAAAAAVANRPVSKVAALWEKRCREEAAQVQSARFSAKRRSRSGSPGIGQIAKRQVYRTYSPSSSSIEDSASSVTTGDYHTAPSTSDGSEIPPPLPPPLHAQPTVILHGHQGHSSVHIQEMRLDFESKLAALGFEMVGQTADGGVAAVTVSSSSSPVQTVRAEPALGVSRAALMPDGITMTDRLPPSGVSRSAMSHGNTPRSIQQSGHQEETDSDEEDEDDAEETSSDPEDFNRFVAEARRQVDEVVRQQVAEELQYNDDGDEDEEEDFEDNIEPPPPPPPRGRSLGMGYNIDTVSTNSTSAWNSLEDIHAVVDRIRSSSRQIDETEEDSKVTSSEDAIDSLSFASSENEEITSDEPIVVAATESKPLSARKSSAKYVKKKDHVAEERERDLKRQLIVQDGVIQQTMKALLECQSRRQEQLTSAKKKGKLTIGHLFGATKVEPASASKMHGAIGCTVGSMAEAELYRVLLIANERRKAIHSELRRLASGRVTAVDTNDIPPVTVTLSEISLQLKHEFRMRQISAGDWSELYYFVVLLRHGPTVLHTVCIGTDEARDGCITFPNMLQFSDVRALGSSDGSDNELNMKISIYGLTLPRDCPASYDTLKHKKTGHHHHHSSSPTSSVAIPPNSGISTPFYCVDSASITREIIRQAATSSRGVASVPLHCMPSKWPLMPSVKFRARCALSAPIEHSGFLTFFTSASSTGSLPAWHRRWAHLRTTEIFFYAEPDAEPANPSPPLPCFDLHAVSPTCQSAEQVSGFNCARPWTLELVLDGNNGQSHSSSASSVSSSQDGESRLWFAADTRNDFVDWRTAINRALSAIKLWGLIGNSQQTVVAGASSNHNSSSSTFNITTDVIEQLV